MNIVNPMSARHPPTTIPTFAPTSAECDRAPTGGVLEDLTLVELASVVNIAIGVAPAGKAGSDAGPGVIVDGVVPVANVAGIVVVEDMSNVRFRIMRLSKTSGALCGALPLYTTSRR